MENIVYCISDKKSHTVIFEYYDCMKVTSFVL